jgi:hypothetical protein
MLPSAFARDLPETAMRAPILLSTCVAILIAQSAISGQASAGSAALCAREARANGLHGHARREFQTHCLSATRSAEVLSDPSCQRVVEDTRISDAAEARLERLSVGQRRAGADCQIEKTMFDANEDMLALIERNPNHCGHSGAGLALMRASQRTMRAIGC